MGKFAYYHVPTYSACLEDDDNDLTWVDESTKNWIPLFQDYSFNGVFENHVHMMKRTLPLTDGKKDLDNGVIYFGDGNWGVEANTCTKGYEGNKKISMDAWGNDNHVWIIQFTDTTFEIFAVDKAGEQILDESTTGTF